jgi:putative membrane protein
MSERMRYLGKPSRDELARRLMLPVWILTAVVLGLVVAMRRIKIPLPEGWDFSFLPAVNAAINSIVAVLLLAALVAVLKGRITLHRNLMMTAVGGSIVFLLCYVAYHLTTGETPYGGEGAVRMIYYFILITHVVLAAVSFPFILMTLVFALTNQFGKHARMARRIYPVWLYVAITGPVVYLMLKPYY